MQNVLWLAAYPYEKVQEIDLGESHPAPWITELEKEISQKVNLVIASSSKSIRKAEKITKNGVKYIFCPSPRLRYDLLTFYRIRISRLLNEIKNSGFSFDVIHVHGTESQYDEVANRLNVPYVISIQGVIDRCRAYYPKKLSAIYASWFLKSLYEKTAVRKGRNFICRTYLDNGFVRTHNSGAKIYQNWELLRPEFFGSHNDYRSKNLLFLGGSNQFKGFKETLKCFEMLRREGYDFRLRVCGLYNKQDVVKLIKRENLHIDIGDMEFLGYQASEQLVELFKDSLCLIHPSYMDNSPNSICEAQVSGLPVIAADVGGVPSLIEDHETGMLVERYDYRGIADKVVQLTNDEKLYRKISEKSRAIAETRHNRQEIIDRTLAIYQDVIKRREI